MKECMTRSILTGTSWSRTPMTGSIPPASLVPGLIRNQSVIVMWQGMCDCVIWYDMIVNWLGKDRNIRRIVFDNNTTFSSALSGPTESSDYRVLSILTRARPFKFSNWTEFHAETSNKLRRLGFILVKMLILTSGELLRSYVHLTTHILQQYICCVRSSKLSNGTDF